MKSSEGVKITEEYHAKYMQALRGLWDSNKAEYAKEGTTDLKLVE